MNNFIVNLFLNENPIDTHIAYNQQFVDNLCYSVEKWNITRPDIVAF